MEQKSNASLLVVILAGIGDLVMATPTLRALRMHFPGSRISVLTTHRSAELIRGLSSIDDIYTLSIGLDQLSVLKALFSAATWKTVFALRRQRFDTIVNLQAVDSRKGALEMAGLLWLLGGKKWAGRNTDGHGFFYDIRVAEKRSDGKHESALNLEIAKALGAGTPAEPEFEVAVSAADEERVAGMLSEQGLGPNDFLIGFNPGAFRPSRRWPSARWALLGDTLQEKSSAKIVIMGNSSEALLVQEITGAMKHPPVALTGKLTLTQLAALLKRLDLFITNDSGPMHIAAALGTPLIALFGPGDLGRVNPRGKGQRIVLRKDVACPRPCYEFSCERPLCMEAIETPAVASAALSLIKQTKPRGAPGGA